jgi:hypothetical protein
MNTRQVIWLVHCEVLVEPGDLPSGSTKGFLRVTMWADSEESVKERLSGCLESYRWHLISIERAHPIEERAEYPEEVSEMIERTRNNENAIILGRIYSYKAE